MAPAPLPGHKTSAGSSTEALRKLRLGPRIKALRSERGWTLNEASARTGLSRASISKIERDEMSPTFDALRKLAMGFEIDITELFTARSATAASGRRSITRADEAKTYASPNYGLKALAADLAAKAMLPFEVAVRARSLDEFADWDRHDSEDFMYVVSGAMTFYSEHYEPVVLEAGDSVYFDGRLGHACVSSGESEAVALWVSAG